MALITPLLSPIDSFDATKSHQIPFMVNGGDQVVKNEIKITLNSSSSEVVYNHTENTFNLYQTIPANTLENGNYYSVYYRTYNANDSHSDWSIAEPFYCYSEPSVTLNIEQDQEVNESNLQVVLTYNQNQGELLNYGEIELYDENQKLIETSSYLYNASTTLPLNVYYTFRGLINMNTYYVKAKVNTLSNMNVETRLVRFHIRYTNPILHANFEATANNCKGYVNLSSNVAVVNGDYNPTTEQPTYINNDAVDLRSMVAEIGDMGYTRYVEFASGYILPRNFVMRMWFSVGKINKKIAILQTANGEDTIYLRWVRDTDYDLVELRTDSGTRLISNTVARSNGLNEYFLWLKVDNTSQQIWDLRLECLSNTPTIAEWNNPNTNVQNLTTSDLHYVGESYEPYIRPSTRIRPLKNDITDIIIGNGVFYGLTLSNDINMEYNNVQPTKFDNHTIMNCQFHGNLNGGSADTSITNLSKLRIKRREKGKTNLWCTVYEKDILDFSDLSISYNDYYVPALKTQQYALVPVLTGNIEGDYYTTEIAPEWQKINISDKNEHYSFIGNVTLASFNQNIQVGLLQPIGKKYPTVVQNATTNYLTGQVTVLMESLLDDGTLDRLANIRKIEKFKAFLTNGNAKVLTDYNGRSVVFKVSDIPTEDLIANIGFGMSNIGFTFVEQGAYDNHDDLKDLGLI